MNKTSKPIPWTEVERVIISLKKAKAWDDLLLFTIATHTALRCCDWQTLRWNHFINQDGSIKSEYTPKEKKTGKKRRITLGATISEVLEMVYLEKKIRSLASPLFVSKRGKRAGNGGLTTDGGNIRLKRIITSYGLSDYTTHSMRKACATNAFLQMGGDFKAMLLVQKMLEHASPATTVRYLGLDDEKIVEYYKSL